MKIKSIIIDQKDEQDSYELVEICREAAFYKEKDLRNKERQLLFVECYDIFNEIFNILETKKLDFLIETDDERGCFAAKDADLRIFQIPRAMSSASCNSLITLSFSKSDICDFNEMKEKINKKNQQNQQQ